MVMTISILIIFTLSYFFSKQIHKFNYYIYVVAGVISLIFAGAESNIITLGYIALSFMVVVMYTGVFQKGNIRKRLMTVRAENAILGVIFLLPHAIGFISYYLEYSNLLENVVPLIGIAAFIISIPLFVTSFRFIRKHFNYKEWKQIHLLAYLFYTLIFVHLILINNSRLVLYIIVFGAYFILKSYDLISNKRKSSKK